MTEKLGILGRTLSHSLSPVLHRIIGRNLGIDLSYELIEIEDSGGKLKELVSKGYKGLSVTVPYKVSCLDSVYRMDEAVKAIGAANTLLISRSKIHAFNTDWSGFLESLKIKGFHPEGKRAVVFGAGGAAKAIVYALIKAGIERIDLSNRTSERAEKMAEQFSAVKICRPDSKEISDAVKNCDLIVNTTTSGMFPNMNEKPFELKGCVNSSTLVYDVIYNPEKTELLSDAAGSGAEIMNGMDMLIFQALDAVKIWFEIDEIEDRIIKNIKSEFLREIK